jgi:hypothetical protein
MNQQDAGRLATGVILGVVGAVAITKSGLSPQASILRWLLFALAAGILVNTQEGKRLSYLTAAAALSAFSLVATVLWVALLNDGVIPSVSGAKIDFSNRLLFGATLMSGIWVLSTAAVLVCSLSRPVTLGLIHNVLSIEIDQAKKIETLLKVLVSIVSTGLLFIFSIL